MIVPALEAKAIVQAFGLGKKGDRWAQAIFNVFGWDAGAIPGAFRLLDTTERPEQC